MAKEIQPLGERTVRLREHGRIRMGAKTEATATKKASFDKLSTFRFTSTDAEVLHELAVLYGGEVRPWHDDRANPPDQFEVISESSRIEVFIVEGGLSIWYEQWGGGGIQRRCDGRTVSLADDVDADCLCRRQGALSCRPTTRVRVIIPGITFGGVWRLESKGWNAMEELDATQQLLFGLTSSQVIRAYLGMEVRHKVVQGKKKQFVVPYLQPAVSVNAMLEGGADVKAIASADRLSLPAPAPDPDEEEIEAELVDDDEPVSVTESLASVGVKLRTEHGARNPLDDQLLTLAAEMIAWSGSRYGKDDDEVLNTMTKERSNGAFRDWTLLDDDRKVKVIDFMREVTANRCLPGEAELFDGGA